VKTDLALDPKAEARAQLRTALETAVSPFDAEYKREADRLLTELR